MRSLRRSPLGGITVLTNGALTAVPYFAWGAHTADQTDAAIDELPWFDGGGGGGGE